MILLDMKNSKTASSPLGLATSKEKPLLSFSDLLKSAGDKEGKIVQNGSLVLALDAQKNSPQTNKPNLKVQTSASLLKVDEKTLKINEKIIEVNIKTLNAEEAELLELNPNLTSTLSSADLKTLIADAKNYLKEKIQSSEGYKNAEIKELPKTLGGLIEVAKKMGIDITKISFEEVKQLSLEDTLIQDKNMQLAPKESFVEKKAPQQTTMQQTATKVEHAQTHERVSQHPSIKQESVQKQEIMQKETPLFKAQSEHVPTEQIVQAKANNISKPEHKQIKEKSEDPLTLLLSDEDSSNSLVASITQESLAASSKTTSFTSAQEGIKTLEQLLQGEVSSTGEQSQTTLKTEAFGVHKADSLEVKMNEAKQMIRYLSDDIRNAIDEYKSPFTRIKVQLNPQHLGEVDLTVVQRGKNLHVNITSNNSAINTLAMNVNELKVQLNNNGINNATFHFNENSQQSFADGQNSSQQRQNEQRRAHEEYNYFENEEANEEILSSLEIIVPQYI